MKNYYYSILFIFAFVLISCNGNNFKSDAYGNFEATEIIVSAEGNGKILNFNIEEGIKLKKGDNLGCIDTTQLYLKKRQLVAQRAAIFSKSANIIAQIEVFEQEKNTLLIEKNRIEKLLKDGAATSKQLDDINGRLNVNNSQINSVRTQNIGILSEYEGLSMQIAQIQDQINKSLIICPIDGIVLKRYAEKSEFVNPGKALFKIADLTYLDLRVYIDGSQLPFAKIGENVDVIIDKNKKENQQFSGKISWISEQAEFTPKIIQTKKERVDLVYAMKVKVQNDGQIKIGMPGEINFIKK